MNVFKCLGLIILGLFLTSPSYSQPLPSIVDANSANISFPKPVTNNANSKPIFDQRNNEDAEALKTFMTALETRCLSNWESNQTSIRNNPQVSFEISCDGIFEKIKLLNPSGIAQEDFNALEAVRESSRFVDRLPKVFKCPCPVILTLRIKEKTNNFACAESLLSEHEKKEDDQIVWHLLPLDCLNCSPDLKPSLVHSNKFLRLVKLTESNRRGLEQASNEWTVFLRTKKSFDKSEIIAKAIQMSRKYSYLFDSRGRTNSSPRT